jgi:hypothetical protein
VSQNNPRPSLSRKAGRGFLRLLRGLLGDRAVARTVESVEVLKKEYAAGKAEAQETEPPPRAIPHREAPRQAPDPPPDTPT